MTGYTVSFIPGSSGRFIANLLYSLLNNLDLDVHWTQENSAHDVEVYRYNIDTKALQDYWMMNNSASVLRDKNKWDINHIRLFRHLKFFPSEYIPVLPTHSYPVTEDLDFNSEINARMVIIALRPEDLIEVNINHVIKNIIPFLKKLKSNGFESLSEQDKEHMNSQIEWMSDMKINYFRLDRPKYILEYAEKASKKQQSESFQRFFNPTVDSRYVDKTLLLSYHKLFEYKNGYVGLNELAGWSGSRLNPSLIKTYERYVLGRNALLESLNKGVI